MAPPIRDRPTPENLDIASINEAADKSGNTSKEFFMAYFGWSSAEGQEAEATIVSALTRAGLVTRNAKGILETLRTRTAQTTVKRLQLERDISVGDFDKRHLFFDRPHGARYAWYGHRLSTNRLFEPTTTRPDYKAVMQLYISRIQSDFKKIKSDKYKQETSDLDAARSTPLPDRTSPAVVAREGANASSDSARDADVLVAKRRKVGHHPSTDDVLFSITQEELFSRALYQVNLVDFDHPHGDLYKITRLDYGLAMGPSINHKGLAGLVVRLNDKLPQGIDREQKLGLVFFDPKEGLRPTMIDDNEQLAAAIVSFLDYSQTLSGTPPVPQRAGKALLFYSSLNIDQLRHLPARSRMSTSHDEATVARLDEPEDTVDELPTTLRTPIQSRPESRAQSRSQSQARSLSVDDEPDNDEPTDRPEPGAGLDRDVTGTPRRADDDVPDPTGDHEDNPNPTTEPAGAIQPVQTPGQQPTSTEAVEEITMHPDYPFMVVKEPSIAIHGAAPDLSVDLQHLAVGGNGLGKVEFLSTGAAGSLSAGANPELVDTELQPEAAHRRALYHFETWPAACAFFGFDPTCDSPAAGVVPLNWNRKVYLKAYQMLSVAWQLRTLLRGEDLIIVGHHMGLRKTGMSLACARQLHRFITARSTNVEPAKNEPLFNPKILADKQDIRLNEGVFLFVAPGPVLSTWIKEKKKFFAVTLDGYMKTPRIKLVIAWGAVRQKDFDRGGRFYGAYRVRDEVHARDRPTDDELAAAFGDDIPNPLLVRHLIDRDENNNARPWQYSWWILTTPDTLSRPDRFLLGTATDEDRAFAQDSIKKDPTKGTIWPAVGYVFFDEFHKTRSHLSQSWTAIAHLAGTPQLICISGTPTSALSDLNAALLAATHRHYSPLVARPDGSQTWRTLFYKYYKPHKNHPVALDAQFSRDLRDEVKARIGDDTFWNMQNRAKGVDRYYVRQTVRMSGAVDEATGVADPSLIAYRMPDNVKRDLDLWRRAYCKFAIAFDAELRWTPFTGARGFPAIETPPIQRSTSIRASPSAVRLIYMPDGGISPLTAWKV